MNEREKQVFRTRQQELERRIADESVPEHIREIAQARLMEVKYLSTMLGLYSAEEAFGAAH